MGKHGESETGVVTTRIQNNYSINFPKTIKADKSDDESEQMLYDNFILNRRSPSAGLDQSNKLRRSQPAISSSRSRIKDSESGTRDLRNSRPLVRSDPLTKFVAERKLSEIGCEICSFDKDSLEDETSLSELEFDKDPGCRSKNFNNLVCFCNVNEEEIKLVLRPPIPTMKRKNSLKNATIHRAQGIRSELFTPPSKAKNEENKKNGSTSVNSLWYEKSGKIANFRQSKKAFSKTLLCDCADGYEFGREIRNLLDNRQFRSFVNIKYRN